MSFEPRTFEQILADMITHVRAFVPQLTDFNVGSVIRTILEAAALEDDEQYFQMVQLLDAFSILNATGDTLDERAADFNEIRQGARYATTKLMVFDTNLVRSPLVSGVLIGAATVRVADSVGYPSVGTIRLGPGTASEEDVSFIANDNLGTLTIDPLTPVLFPHAVNTWVNLVTGDPDVLLDPGISGRVPATSVSEEVVFISTGSGVLRNGMYASSEIPARATVAGKQGNVVRGSVKSFVGAPPVAGALITNSADAVGGMNRESDVDFVSRLLKKIQALGRGTCTSLEACVIGVIVDTFRVQSAAVFERFLDGVNDCVDLYVWPGQAGFDTTEQIATEVVVAAAREGQRFFKLQHTPVVPGTLRLYHSLYGLLVEGVDYVLNTGTGWLEVLNGGLSTGDSLVAGSTSPSVAGYTAYTGLIRECQRVVSGDPNARVTYPGYRAAGVRVQCLPPILVGLPTIFLDITTLPNWSREDVAPFVVAEIRHYLLGLRGGSSVIISEMIERAMGVAGMFNVKVRGLAGDVVLAPDEVIDPRTIQIEAA